MPAAFICQTCGVQYAPSNAPPERCPICEDERQYVGWQGQRWTTVDELTQQGHANGLRELERGLWHLATMPAIAISAKEGTTAWG